MSAEQFELFKASPTQSFNAFIKTRAGKMIAQHCFIFSVPYLMYFKKTGLGVSFKLIWELVRYHFAKEHPGYYLNNSHTRPMAEFIILRRPDWAGLFEFRSNKAQPTNRRAVVIPIKEARRA